ncbi:MAG: hypothetical protein M3441_07970 [Chloroflexota bacterium]|nr:hypothetical protein [Chloroflexota bacterium]
MANTEENQDSSSSAQDVSAQAIDIGIVEVAFAVAAAGFLLFTSVGALEIRDIRANLFELAIKITSAFTFFMSSLAGNQLLRAYTRQRAEDRYTSAYTLVTIATTFFLITLYVYTAAELAPILFGTPVLDK